MIQRKPPAKRLFTGGVGGVFNSPADAPPIPSVYTSAHSMDAFQPETVQTMTAQEILVAINHPKAVAAETAVQKHRRLKREQSAAAKEKIKTPWQERDAQEAAHVGEVMELKFEEVKLKTGGTDKAEAVAARAAQLGSPTDDGGDESYWPTLDRKEVKPEGSSETHKVDTKKWENSYRRSSFRVKLSGPEGQRYEDDLTSIVKFYFIRVVDGDDPQPGEDLSPREAAYYKCKLCDVQVEWESEERRHMETIHGDEMLETHDARYGDVIERYVKAGRRFPKIADPVKIAKTVAAPPRKRLHRNVLKTNEVAT